MTTKQTLTLFSLLISSIVFAQFTTSAPGNTLDLFTRGNVNIGTSNNPAFKLNVNGNSLFSGNVGIGYTSPPTFGINKFMVNGGSFLNGNVGIGTQTPVSKLDLGNNYSDPSKLPQ